MFDLVIGGKFVCEVTGSRVFLDGGLLGSFLLSQGGYIES